jgi:hypothetical protein
MYAWPDNVSDLHMSFKSDPLAKISCNHTPLFDAERAPHYVKYDDVNDTESNVIMEEVVLEEEARSHWKVIEVSEFEITNVTIQVS